jgi:alcohol dehydrogenase (NADP+)
MQKTPAQVALRSGIQMGHSVLPKSANETDGEVLWNQTGML